MDKISVLLVEDDPVWSRAVEQLVNQEKDMVIAGVAADQEEAVDSAYRLRPDVILMDIVLKEICSGGIEAAEEIHGKLDCKIIMLTSMSESSLIIDSISAGAVNYIDKANHRELAEMIRCAYRNESGIHPCASEALRNELVRLKREEVSQLVTGMEKEILKEIDKGRTQSEIAEHFQIAERTLKNHVNRILKKLKLKSSKEAAQYVKRKGLFRN